MERLGVKVCAFLVLAAAGCDDGGGSGGGPQSDGGTDKSSIRYPDSLCSTEACSKNTDAETVCDPDGTHVALPLCNAWEITGRFALQAVKVTDSGTPGRPSEEPTKDEEDTCPHFMVQPSWVEGEHCCQRVDNSTVDLPAFKLTALVIDTPAVYSQQVVSATNADAIQEDRYNWMMLLSGKPDAGDTEIDVEITSGTALQNTDGTFTLVDGTTMSGGETFNQNGEWDPHKLPGKLTKSGDGWRIAVAPWLADRPIEIPMWVDENINFVAMALAMNGVEMAIDLDPTLSCGGVHNPFGDFSLPGTLRAFLPIDALMDTCLVLTPFASCEAMGNPMCEFTAGVRDCAADRAQWEAR